MASRCDATLRYTKDSVAPDNEFLIL